MPGLKRIQKKTNNQNFTTIVKTKTGNMLKIWKLTLMVIMMGSAITAYSVSIELDDARPYGNIGKPAVNPSNLVNVGGYIYETRFEPDEYTGDVVARKINSEGKICQDEVDDDGYVTGVDSSNPAGCPGADDAAAWRAHEQLPDPDLRIIFTQNVPFVWDDLGPTLQNELDILGSDVEDGETDSNGHKLVAYLRGKSDNEGSEAGKFRQRQKEDHKGTVVHYPLGDFVHAAVQYVGPPVNLYSDPQYLTFLVNNKDRKPMIYAGANDGMLHAFEAETGTEAFAFIPVGVYPRLKHLSDQAYQQTYFVDGSPAIMAAKGNFPACPGVTECWRTILVGGLNSGGRSIYALDVTDPEPDDETEAGQDLFLWENTNLGYSFSRPVIGKLNDGRWVVIYGNGIDDVDETDSALPVEPAALYLVDITTGTVIDKVVVESASANNGILSPTLFDADFDGDIDYVYAGDTDGSLWKFDLTTVDSGGDFDATIFYNDGDSKADADGLPLAQVTGTDTDGNTTNLVIQTPPIVSLLPTEQVLVIFGTGRIFGEDDAAYNFGDSLFGILDNADPTSGHGVFPSSNFTLKTYSPITNSDGDVRTLSSGTDPTPDPVGWRVKLDPGERILTDLTLSDKRIGFTSINPLVENSRNWLNGINYITGGTPPEKFLDIDNDGEIDEDDLESSSIPISVDLGHGIVSAPRIANIDGGFDVNLVTNGLKRESTYEDDFDSPFTDPGLIGGHFDLDTFDAVNVKSCWGLGVDAEEDGGGKNKKDKKDKNDKGQECHTREYDDDQGGDGGDDSEDGNGGVEVTPHGVVKTQGTTVSSTNISSTRVSWREVLE